MSERRKNKYNQYCVNNLLDIDSYSGVNKGRLAPTLWFCARVAILPIIYAKFLIFFIPIFIFILVEGYIVLRSALVIFGNEAPKLEQYKKMLDKLYHVLEEILGIKTLYKDGMIEYINGEVSYVVVAKNGNITNELQQSEMKKKIIETLAIKASVDVRVYNVDISEAYRYRYKNVRKMKGDQAQKDCIKYLDANEEYGNLHSRMTEIVFVVTARKAKFKQLRQNIESALNMGECSVFKEITVASGNKLSEIISRDLHAEINYRDIIMSKYFNGDYCGSSVIGYDDDITVAKLLDIAIDNSEEPLGENNEIGGFFINE